MNKIEREVKILNVEPEQIAQQLSTLNAEYIGEKFQQIYTYEITSLPQRIRRIIELVDSYQLDAIEMSAPVSELLSELNFLLSEPDREKLDKLCVQQKIPSWNLLCENVEHYDYYSLLHLANDIFSNYPKNENKWARLRKTTLNDKKSRITLAVKHIAERRSTNKIREYSIDSLREVEVTIDSFESGKVLLESLGYFYRNYQEKKRISYQYKNISIDIDIWPLIPPYLELEADSTEDIYAFIEQLDVDESNIKVMSPDDIFSNYDIELLKIRKLTF